AVEAADLQQDKPTITKGEGKTAVLSCTGTDGCRDYLHWYQRKEEEFRRILYIKLTDGTQAKEPGYDDFVTSKDEPGKDKFTLKISKLQTKHSATYFCACWGERRLVQDLDYVRKKPDKTVYIPCKPSGLSSGDYVHWYQKKEGQPFKRILYISYGSKSLARDENHPQKDDFSAREFDLHISETKLDHTATYYCACWDSHSGKESSGPDAVQN
ncbi:hypothetical protein Z043_117858, partial [Scleropages formosus]